MNQDPHVPTGVPSDTTPVAPVADEKLKKLKQKLEKDYSFLLTQLDPSLKASELPELLELLEEIKEGADMSYADQIVEDLREKFGIKPILTIPREYLETITKEKRVTAREGYIPGVRLIAARFATEPFKEQDDRVAFYIKDHVHIAPRATGKNDTFQGTVVVTGRDSLIYDPDDLDNSDILPIAA